MALNHRKLETERMAQFMAANACLSEMSPFAWDTTGGRRTELMSFDATGAELRVLAYTQTLESIQANPIREALKAILRTFGLTKTMLSDVCCVTRKTVYKWLDEGVTPNPKFQQRIFKLREAALNWQHEAYPYPKNHLHESIMMEQTLLDLLKEDPVDVKRILFAGQRLKLAELDETPGVIPDPFE